MDTLKKLYCNHFDSECSAVSPITGSASDRRYYRLTGSAGSAIGVAGTDLRENETFLYINSLMRSHGINAPEVYGVSADGMKYLQQDLGDVCLLDLLHTPEGDEYVHRVMRVLPDIQFSLEPDDSRLYPVREMGAEEALWDLHYFKYCFLKVSGAAFDEAALEQDFKRLVADLWDGHLTAYIYRDCQSRNVMISGGDAWWIDFQSMRRGPVLYDVASFLWQARAGFTDSERDSFADEYYEAMRRYAHCSRKEFRDMLRRMALMRTLQVLGAYGLRGLTEHKARFVQSIPAALANATDLTGDENAGYYPELRRVLIEVAEMERFHPEVTEGKLHIKVFSFSYKKGYPEDLTGNGGGFMFDCRAMHNPGRYDLYKPLTGRDRPVIDFLEKQGEVQPYLEAVNRLTDPAVERYIKRGFNSLQIGFGCTGGRHRSVYCAEHTARHIAGKYGDKVNVSIIHREQNIREEL